MRPLIVFALIIAPLLAISQTNSRTQSSPTIPNLQDANSEVVKLAIQDQWDRGNDMFGGRQISPPDLQGKNISDRDEERHVAIRQMIADGKVKSGTDFWLSALIFQHSTKPDDLLLAHLLAVTAASKGNKNGKWLSAASLDRYLWQINQSQIFGTQFKTNSDGKWTMEPYARQTISDAERAVLCVVPLERQRAILKEAQAGKPLESTGLTDCP
jgi:hypothetical protein